MSRRLSRLFVLVMTTSCAGGIALAIDGCGADSDAPLSGPTEGAPSGKEGSGNDDDSGKPGTDAGLDAADAAKVDAEAGPNTGETCIGFGKGTPCGAGAFPDYGYVCFNGGPPGFASCKQASSTSFGDTWCCPENKCVAQPDQDSKTCTNASKPHRYQCPPDGDGGNVAPPASCTDGGAGGSAVELFYCCP